MHGTSSLVLAILVSAAGGDTVWKPVDYVAVDPKDVEFRVELVGPNPLPYQAVRLRATLKNVSTKRIGPIGAVDNTNHLLINGPREPDLREAHGALLSLIKGRPSNPTVREVKNNEAPTTLDPGEEMSASFAVAAQWTGDGGGWLPAARVKPIFPAPFPYNPKLIYQIEYKDRQLIAQGVSVVAHEPKGEDKAVYQLLQKDPEMVATLLSPVGSPDEKVLARIQELLKEHPKTSYTPYARFAVARYYAHKEGPDYRIHRATAATELAKIMRVDWPYQPNALILMRKMAPLERDATDPILKERFADAIEWLEVVAETATPEEWQKFRKRTAPKDGPQTESLPSQQQ